MVAVHETSKMWNSIRLICMHITLSRRFPP